MPAAVFRLPLRRAVPDTVREYAPQSDCRGPGASFFRKPGPIGIGASETAPANNTEKPRPMLPPPVRQTGPGSFTGIFPCRASDRNPHAIGQTKTESAEHAGPFGRTAIFDYSCSRMARRVHGSYRSFRAMTTTGLFPADVRASGNRWKRTLSPSGQHQ